MLHTRLSKHFILFDFLADLDVRASPLVNKAAISSALDHYLSAGAYLCEELLEPLTRQYGPSSISSGLCPGCPSPHGWITGNGAGCDIAFHDWVNRGAPPFHLVAEVDQSTQTYERAIAYAGSEYLCLSIKTSGNRRALYENVRVPGQDKPTFINYNSAKRRLARATGDFAPEPRPDWQREADEPVYHTRRSLRPQHVRVGEYFTLLDIARNVDVFNRGHTFHNNLIYADLTPFRAVASVLDHAVRYLGRVSIYRGLNRREHRHDYDWLSGGPKRVQFLTGNPDINVDEYLDHMIDHGKVDEIEVFQFGDSYLTEIVIK